VVATALSHDEKVALLHKCKSTLEKLRLPNATPAAHQVAGPVDVEKAADELAGDSDVRETANVQSNPGDESWHAARIECPGTRGRHQGQAVSHCNHLANAQKVKGQARTEFIDLSTARAMVGPGSPPEIVVKRPCLVPLYNEAQPLSRARTAAARIRRSAEVAFLSIRSERAAVTGHHFSAAIAAPGPAARELLRPCSGD